MILLYDSRYRGGAIVKEERKKVNKKNFKILTWVLKKNFNFGSEVAIRVGL